MYTLKKTIAQPEDQRGLWEEVDISNMTGREITTKYSKAYIIIYSKILDRDITISLEDYRTKLEIYDNTFSQYLIDNSNRSFTETNEKVEFTKNRYVKYQDAFRAGYKLEASPEIEASDSELTIENRPFIKMSKEGINPKDFYKYCLCSVNGFIHRVDVSDTGIWIMDGMKTVKKSEDNSVGILSFKDIGSLKIIPITKDMIYSQLNNHPLYDQCYINLKTNTDNKTIILVLGGYIHIYDWLTFRRVSLEAIRIDFKNIPLFERYHESKRFIDFSDSPLQRGHDDGGVAIGDLTSDDFIKYYLTIPQSFIAILDNEDIYVDRIDIEPNPIPGQYISYIKPDLPLINGRGKIVNYKKFKSKRIERWVLNTKENQYHRWGYLTTDYKDYNAVTDSRLTQTPTEHSHAYFLKIGSNVSRK